MTTLFGHSVRSELLLLSLAEAILGFLAAYGLLTWAVDLIDPRQAVTLAAGLALCSGLLSGIGGLYQPRMLSRTGSLFMGTAMASLVLLVLSMAALGMLVPTGSDGTVWQHLVTVPLILGLVVLAVRLGFLAAARNGLLCRRLAVVGGADLGEARSGGLGRAADPFEVVLPIAATQTLSPEWLRAQQVWGIVVPDPTTLPPATQAGCREAGVRLFGEAEFREQRLGRLDIDALPEGWLAGARGGREEGRCTTAARRSLDILLSLALLLLTLPLLLVTALAIRLDSRGPVFYRQERVGQHNRVFTLLKFRSMVVDAEAGGAPQWATKRDARVTRVGRFIRLTRIDEIPQVLNVLKGDMAFVGPRPERPAFVERLAVEIPRYHDRAVVKPGITGWAQVNYPYGASVEDARMKLAYDLYYIKRRSLFLDLLILLATVRVVLFQEGAR